jgi:hypothetical protein
MSTIRLEDLDPSHFESRLGQRIRFRWPQPEASPESVELEVFRVTRLPERPPGAAVRGIPLLPRPFSLLFRSSDQRPLGSGSPELDDPRFEPAPMLLTPVAPASKDPAGFYFEAVFN